MSRITIPFKPEMKQAISIGTKNCTSRYQKYGEAGDTFMVNGEEYELTGVVKYDYGVVRYNLYKREGFLTPREFSKYWTKLHPRRKINSADKVWTHFFRRR